MIMQQLTGHGHTESCIHLLKVRENINPQGDEGHNRVCYNQKRFMREHGGEKRFLILPDIN